ncbi:MAG: isopentenyl-diphosphate delta-isomerase, type 1 [Verrucomicrobiota bacterium]|jgi:isopentenyl-diphosphate delta-isomerase
MPENLIVVNSRNRAVGVAEKQAAHASGLLHRAFSIFLIDDRGRVLLQRRHAKKYHSGGLWSNACCGHPRPGEKTRVAASRRLGEELGVRPPLQFVFRTRYATTFANGLQENEIVYLYFGSAPARLAPDPAEVSATHCISLPALRKDIRARPQCYSYWLRFYVERHYPELRAAINAVRRGPERAR